MYCLIWMKLNFFILSCKILVKWYCKVYTMCSIVKYRKCMAYCKNAVFFLSLYLFIIFVLFFLFPTESPRREIYFLAMIDILTKYGVKKRTATAAKTVKHGAGAEFSTVRHDQYAKRFLEFINKCIEWWPRSLCSHFHSVFKKRRWWYFVPQILCNK